jgi:flagellar hook-associated protein 1 FlgK
MGLNFSSFDIGRRALRSAQLGIDITGKNIANVNTPGYTRLKLANLENGSTLEVSGDKLTVDGVRQERDRLIEARLQKETANTGRLSAKRDALQPVDAVFNDASSPGGIQSALSGFFGAFRALEAQPTSVEARTSIANKAETLANAFQSARGRLGDIRSDANSEVLSTVSEANPLLQRVADLNGKISAAENLGEIAFELRDQRAQAVTELSEKIGVRVSETADGKVTLSLDDGRALVVGERAFTLGASGTPDGSLSLQVDGEPVAISNGKLKGLQEALDEIDGQISDLDDLAGSVADRVNTLHASGSDLDGNNGTNLFASADGDPINAANISLSATIKANPRLVVGAANGAGSGDSTIAREAAGLLQDRTSLVGGQTTSFDSFYASLVTRAGSSLSSTDDLLKTQQLILSQTTAQRESVSGVSLDEEAINLLQYQRAFEAAARFLNVADEMTRTILELAR